MHDLDTATGTHTCSQRSCFLTVRVAVLCIIAAASALAADERSPAARSPPSAATPGLTAKEFENVPGVIFARALADVPGKNLVVVALDFLPEPPQQTKIAPQCPGHRHPGSTYVYVTKGAVRLGIAGKPVQIVHAGESFFEPPHALHTVAENASATEPASAIAVLILPAGAPILTPEAKCGTP